MVIDEAGVGVKEPEVGVEELALVLRNHGWVWVLMN